MRFRLRSLFVLLMAFSVVVVLGARNYQRVQDERAAIDALQTASARVVYDEAPGWFAACLRSPYQATSVSFRGASPTPSALDPNIRSIVKMVGRCPGVEALMIRKAFILEEDVWNLRSLSRLQSVDLSYCRIDAAATAGLFQLGHVTSLDLCGVHLTIQREAKLTANRRLRHLNLSNTSVDDTDVLTLANCFPALQSLLLRGTSVTDRGIPTILERLSQLQVLDLGRTGISGQPFSSGVELSRLEVLLLPDVADVGVPTGHYGRAIFYDRRVINPDAVVHDVDLDDLVSLPMLRKLDLSGRTIRAANRSRQWPSLKWLALSGSSVDDMALLNIGDAPQLRELGIADTAVTDAGLAKLVRMFPSLRSLDLRGTAVSLDGLTALSALRELDEVYVSAKTLGCSRKSLTAVFETTNVTRVYLHDDNDGAVTCDADPLAHSLSILSDVYPLIQNYPIEAE